MQQFKILYNNALEEAKSGRPARSAAAEEDGDGADAEAANADGGVGELVGGGGGSIGRAPDGAKPTVSVKDKVADPSSPHADKSVAASPKRAGNKAGAGAGGAMPPKSEAFEEFKETDGKDLNKVSGVYMLFARIEKREKRRQSPTKPRDSNVDSNEGSVALGFIS